MPNFLEEYKNPGALIATPVDWRKNQKLSIMLTNEAYRNNV